MKRISSLFIAMIVYIEIDQRQRSELRLLWLQVRISCDERRLNEYPWRRRNRTVVTSDQIFILYNVPILSLTSFITYILYLYIPSLTINVCSRIIRLSIAKSYIALVYIVKRVTPRKCRKELMHSVMLSQPPILNELCQGTKNYLIVV